MKFGFNFSFKADYHNLIMIASELVQALAASVNGEEVRRGSLLVHHKLINFDMNSSLKKQITPDYLSSIFQRLSTFKKTHEKRNQESVRQEEITNPLILIHCFYSSLDTGILCEGGD